MGEYQRTRDEAAGAMYEFTCELATLEPPPSEMQRIARGDTRAIRKAMDGFAR